MKTNPAAQYLSSLRKMCDFAPGAILKEAILIADKLKKSKKIMLDALNAATYKLAKKVQQGLLVSDEEFKEMVEAEYKDDIFLGFIEGVFYQYGTGVGKPAVKIFCRAKEQLYKCSFYLNDPPGKFSDRSKVISGVTVKEVEEDLLI